MSKRGKIWLIIAASLVVVGLVLFVVVMSAYDWDFTKLSTQQYETNTFSIDQDFNNISINTDTADILFSVSNDHTRKVECYEPENLTHLVDVRNDTLFINVEDQRNWHEYIGINFSTPKITLFLPAAEYDSLVIKESTGDIQIPKDFHFIQADIAVSTGDVNCFASATERFEMKTDTGDIHLEDVSTGTLDLSTSTGDVTALGVTCQENVEIHVSTGKTTLTDVSCKNVISGGSTGDLSLKNVVAAEKFSITRSTGDVKFEKSDAAEIFVKTDTGNVKGSLLSNKVFIAQTDTGRVEIPKTVTGGKCEITTDTGNIKINISG